MNNNTFPQSLKDEFTEKVIKSFTGRNDKFYRVKVGGKFINDGIKIGFSSRSGARNFLNRRVYNLLKYNTNDNLFLKYGILELKIKTITNSWNNKPYEQKTIEPINSNLTIQTIIKNFMDELIKDKIVEIIEYNIIDLE